MIASSLRCTALLAAIIALGLVAGPTVADEGKSITGHFKGNGKTATLTCVSAEKKTEDGKTRTVLIFSEKEPAKGKKPDFEAMFGRLGSALIITVKEDGQVVGCFVAHAEHKKGGFNAIGDIKMSDFKVADGKLTGKLSTGGEVEAFGEKWDVDIKFTTKAPK